MNKKMLISILLIIILLSSVVVAEETTEQSEKFNLFEWIGSLFSKGETPNVGGKAYELGENGICTCNTCSDCNNAIDSDECATILITEDIQGEFENSCIRSENSDSDKIIDCQGNKIFCDATDNCQWSMYLENKNNFTVQNCRMETSLYGFEIADSTNCEINNIYVYNPQIDSFTLSGSNNEVNNLTVEHQMNAMNAGGSVDITGDTNTINDLTVFDTSKNGVEVEGINHVFNRLTIYDVERVGLVINDCGGCEFYDSVIHNTKNFGIHLSEYAPPGVLVDTAEIYNNDYAPNSEVAGIKVDSSGHTLINIDSYNNRYGIHLGACDNNLNNSNYYDSSEQDILSSEGILETCNNYNEVYVSNNQLFIPQSEPGTYTINGDVCECNTCQGCDDALDSDECASILMTEDFSHNPSARSSCISSWKEDSGKVIDCQGHTITCERPTVCEKGMWIRFKENFTIQNCKFHKFKSGFLLASSDNCKVDNINVTDSLNDGITIQYVDNTNITNIATNDIGPGGFIYSAIFLEGNSNYLANAKVFDSHERGIFIRGEDNILENIVVNKTSNIGFYIHECESCEFYDIAVHDTRSTGLLITEYASNIIIDGAEIYNNDQPNDSGISGITLASKNNNILTNINSYNNRYGISISSCNNTITNSVFRDNSNTDILFSQRMPQTCNTYDEVYLSNNQLFIPNAGGDNYTINGNICECDTCYGCNNALDDSECTEIRITNDLEVTEGTYDCISKSDVDNKIIDCQNHKIFVTTESFFTSGFKFTSLTDSVIKNCDISGFFLGLKIGESKSSTLENINISDVQNGMLLGYQTADRTLVFSNNYVNNINIHLRDLRQGENLGGKGIELLGSLNTFTNLKLDNCKYVGIISKESRLNNFQNVIVNNSGYGMHISDSIYNQVTNLTVQNSRTGLKLMGLTPIGNRLRSSDNNNFSNLRIFDNEETGVVINEFSKNNQITNAEVYNNKNGIVIDGCENTILDSTFYDNTIQDILITTACENYFNNSGSPTYNNGTSNETTIVCGDGIIDEDEECDDNNIINSDGCSMDCLTEVGWTCKYEPSVCTEEINNPNCGNNITEIDLGEECDDGDQNGIAPSVGYGLNTTYCNALCINSTTFGSYCGDGTCDSGESTSSCNEDCKSSPSGSPGGNTNNNNGDDEEDYNTTDDDNDSLSNNGDDTSNDNQQSDDNTNTDEEPEVTSKIINESINFTKQITFEITKMVANEEVLEEHTITLQEIRYSEGAENNYAILVIRSDPKEIQLFEGQPQAIDIDGDNIPDIIATVNNISSTSTEMVVYKIGNSYFNSSNGENEILDPNEIITTNFYILVVVVIIITVGIAVFYSQHKKKHHRQQEDPIEISTATSNVTNTTKTPGSIKAELMNYVAKAIENNLTDKDIMNNLIKAGWNDSDIREAIKNIRTL